MKLSISQTLGLAFGFAILGVGGFVGLTLYNGADDIPQLQAIDQIDQARSLVQDLELRVSNIWQFLTDAPLTRNLDSINVDAKKNYDQALTDLKVLKGLPVLPDQDKLLATFGPTLERVWSTGTEMFGAYVKSKAEGDRVMEQFDGLGDQLSKDIEALRDPLLKLRTDKLAAYETNLQQDRGTLIVTGALAIVILALIGVFLTRTLGRPIRATSRALRVLADGQGDLTVRLKEAGGTETTNLARSLNDFLDKLRSILVAIDEMVHKNQNLARSLNQSSRESASSVSDLSVRVTTLTKSLGSLDIDIAGASAAIEEILANISSLAKQIGNQDTMVSRTGSAVQQMMLSITGVSELAENRVASVAHLVDLTRQGGDRVKKTNKVIGKVAENADAMTALIALINDISDRTNLLAMNASIEAAHAGAAGRGFGVVANEIRKLAFDTGANAQKIGESLKESAIHIRQAQQDSLATQEAFLVLEHEVTEFASAMHEVSTSMTTLSQGGIEILEATAELIQTSQVISNSSQEMNFGAQEILTAVHHVRQVSSESLAEVAEVDGLSQALNRVALRVSAFGNQNRYNNTVLAGEVGKFLLGVDPTARSEAVALGIDWSDLLSVGIATMDDEHKELFRRINALLVALLGPEGHGDTRELVAAIREYTVFHFTDEEKLMRAQGYPRYEQHKALHAAFVQEFETIEEELLANGLTAALVIRLQDKVVTWLLDHIAKVDHDYGEFMASQGVTG